MIIKNLLQIIDQKELGIKKINKIKEKRKVVIEIQKARDTVGIQMMEMTTLLIKYDIRF